MNALFLLLVAMIHHAIPAFIKMTAAGTARSLCCGKKISAIPMLSAYTSASATTTASELLAAYDAGHRAAAASQGAQGFGGGITANEWAAKQEYEPLADAVRVLWEAASRIGGVDYNGEARSVDDGRLILGICADDAMAGVSALKAWVTALSLPKGPLHGMDKEGEPLDMSTFGPVYIKYNSLPPPAGGITDPPGTARLSGYNGDFRGVYVNANLADGVFRQYAVLPLDLFSDATGDPVQLSANRGGSLRVPEEAPATAARAVSDASAGLNTREGRSVGQQRKASTYTLNAASVRALLLDLPDFQGLAALGIAISVREVQNSDAEGTAVGLVKGRVLLSYHGPAKLRAAVELNLRNALRKADPRVRVVEFI